MTDIRPLARPIAAMAAAAPLRAIENASLDPDIHCIHWLDYEAILAQSARMRSPLVLPTVERYRKGHCYPVDFVYIDEPQRLD